MAGERGAKTEEKIDARENKPGRNSESASCSRSFFLRIAFRNVAVSVITL